MNTRPIKNNIESAAVAAETWTATTRAWKAATKGNFGSAIRNATKATRGHKKLYNYYCGGGNEN